MFLWWFQGGHIIPVLGLKPSPAELIVISTTNAFKTGLATIFNAILNLFR
jgi:microcystin degradation protein MlrC